MKRKPSVGRMATTAKPLCLGTAWHVEFTIIDDTRRSRFRRKCRFSEDGPPRVLKTADADGAASLTPTSDQLPRSLMIRKRTATYWTSGCRFTISPTNASSISSRFFKRSLMNSSQRPWTAALRAPSERARTRCLSLLSSSGVHKNRFAGLEKLALGTRE